MTPLPVLLAILAVWRLTHLLTAEDGPFDLVVRLRRRAGQGFFGKLLDCFYCLSLWMALPVAFLFPTTWPQRSILWLALSAAAILLNRFAEAFAPDRPTYFEEPPHDSPHEPRKEKP